MNTITIARLGAGSLFRLLLAGLLGSLVPLGLVFGVLGALGYDTVRWNGVQVHGLKALLLSPASFALVAVLAALLFGGLAALGLRVYACFRPFSLRYLPCPDASGTEQGMKP